jgi:hypothetical protein
MDNMNQSTKLESLVKRMVNTLQINIIYNKHIEIFKIDTIDNIINKIDEMSLKIKSKNNINIELEKIKLENENLKLKLELIKAS